jgi:UMF1 family MFS transporter
VDDEIRAARFGLLSIIILFILGGYVFSKVDIEEGESMAKNL